MQLIKEDLRPQSEIGAALVKESPTVIGEEAAPHLAEVARLLPVADPGRASGPIECKSRSPDAGWPLCRLQGGAHVEEREDGSLAGPLSRTDRYIDSGLLSGNLYFELGPVVEADDDAKAVVGHSMPPQRREQGAVGDGVEGLR